MGIIKCESQPKPENGMGATAPGPFQIKKRNQLAKKRLLIKKLGSAKPTLLKTERYRRIEGGSCWAEINPTTIPTRMLITKDKHNNPKLAFRAKRISLVGPIDSTREGNSFRYAE
jgi:hypothetical protein